MQQISNRPSLLANPDEIPFIITKNGKPACAVVHPDFVKRSCENCKQSTDNERTFYDEKLAQWRKLVLCDKCEDELLHGNP